MAGNEAFFDRLVSEASGAEDNVVVRDLDVGTFGGGRGLFAKKDIPKGAAVFIDEPLCTVSFAASLCCRCANRLPEKQDKFACPACGAEKYCSARCRELAQRTYHGSQCGRRAMQVAQYRDHCWRNDYPLESGYAPLMAMKIVGLTMQSPQYPCSTFDIPPFRHMSSLMDAPDPALVKKGDLCFPFENRWAQFDMIRQVWLWLLYTGFLASAHPPNTLQRGTQSVGK